MYMRDRSMRCRSNRLFSVLQTLLTRASVLGLLVLGAVGCPPGGEEPPVDAQAIEFGEGQPWRESLNCLERTSSGEFVVGGLRQFGGFRLTEAEPSPAYALLVRADGEISWEKTFLDEHTSTWSNIGVSAIREAAGSGYVVTGALYNDGTSHLSGFLAKLDETGAESWRETFPMLSLWDVQPRPGGGYVVGGSIGAEAMAMVLVTDSEGKEVWRHAFDSHTYGATQVLGLADGSVAVAGDGFTDQSWTFLARLDGAGELQWIRSYAIGYSSHLDRIEGGYRLTAFGQSDGEPVLAEIDEEGEPTAITEGDLGSTYISSDYNIYDVRATADGGMVVCGEDRIMAYDAPPTPRVLVAKMDRYGRTAWRRRWYAPSSTTSVRARRVVELPGGGYVVAGEKSVHGPVSSHTQYGGNRDIWLLRLNESGESVPWAD